MLEQKVNSSFVANIKKGYTEQLASIKRGEFFDDLKGTYMQMIAQHIGSATALFFHPQYEIKLLINDLKKYF
ncbi:MAG: hypothetical protein AABX16_00975 [Nanoarchaeota archaeon]